MSTKSKAAVAAPPSFWTRYAPYLLALFAFLAFANTIGGGYNMDDELVTRKHKYTSKGIAGIRDIITRPYYSDDMGYAYGYRPVVLVSYALEHQLFGEKPAVSHFFNVLLYAVTVMLFFRLLKSWTGEKGWPLAVTATLLFAVHPVHTEVVASLKNRDEILALLFGLLSGIALMKALGKNTALHMVLGVCWFSVALLAKKSMYPLCIIYPLVWMLISPLSLKKILLYAFPSVIMGALIVSELQPGRFLLMAAAPYAVLLAFWYLRVLLSWTAADWRALPWAKIADVRYLVPVAAGLLAYGIRQRELTYLAASLLLIFPVLYGKPRVGMFMLLLYAGVLSYVYESFGLSLAAVMTGIYYGTALYFSDPKNKNILWVYALLALVPHWAMNHDPGSLVLPVILLAVCVLFRIRPRVGYLLALIVLVGSLVLIPQVGMLQIGIVVLSASYFLEQKWPSVTRFHLSACILAIVGFVYFAQINFPYRAVTEQPAAVQTVTTDAQYRTAALQEGRKLEFVENTLTAPHTTGEKIGTGLATLGTYLRLMVFPYELSFYYGYAKTDTVGLDNPWVWLSLAAHLALVILAIWQIRKRPFIGIGIIWYLLGIGLFSNWVELVAGMVGERLAFTASAGFCIFVAALVVWAKPEPDAARPKWVEISLGVLLIVFGMRTLVRNSDWKDALTLMGNDITHLENSAQANNLYALNLMNTSFENKKLKPEQQFNMRKLAVQHFDRALQIWPAFFNAAYDKGRAALIIGDYASAISGFEAAVAVERPDLFMDPYHKLSDLYLKTGRYADFLRNARSIFDKEEKRPESYGLLARGFYLNGRPDSAKTYLRRGMVSYPQDENLRKNLAEIFKAEGKTDSVNYYWGR